MRNSFVLFNRCFVFVALFADITDNLAVFLVAMLVVHVALKAGRMDELETEATLGLTDSVWNKNHELHDSLPLARRLEYPVLHSLVLFQAPVTFEKFLTERALGWLQVGMLYCNVSCQVLFCHRLGTVRTLSHVSQ